MRPSCPASRPHASSGRPATAWSIIWRWMSAGISITFSTRSESWMDPWAEIPSDRLNLASLPADPPLDRDVAGAVIPDNSYRSTRYSPLAQRTQQGLDPALRNRDQQPSRGLGVGQDQLLGLGKFAPGR